MQRDNERNVKVFLERKSGGRIDGEVSVQENGLAAPERTNELRCDTGREEEAAANLVRELVALAKKRGVAGIDEEAGGDGVESGKAGRVAAERLGLSGDKGF
jgi:hypothetical protein